LLSDLLAQGLAQPNDLGLGIRVAEDFAVIAKKGRRSWPLFAPGPVLKGTLLETTAVPEIRVQALRPAEVITGIY